ncbi:hypothetical protein ACKUB1_12860 [Methanospirillum stamsii]|uniref:hypothetical protein n=1 Tax=Methanospirillum stamsii TaxID=1277351 RepID=UPI0011B22DAE|nr:hypothetical protein [Methanospirillum stamsii]
MNWKFVVSGGLLLVLAGLFDAADYVSTIHHRWIFPVCEFRADRQRDICLSGYGCGCLRDHSVYEGR